MLCVITLECQVSTNANIALSIFIGLSIRIIIICIYIYILHYRVLQYRRFRRAIFQGRDVKGLSEHLNTWMKNLSFAGRRRGRKDLKVLSLANFQRNIKLFG